MSVFIDTGVFVAARNAADKNHRKGKELIKRILEGEFGAAYTSDRVIDEAVTTALARTKGLEVAIDIGEFILRSPRIRKLWVSEDIFRAAWERFKSLKKSMSFTDCTSLALIEMRGIGGFASFDTGFDGLVKRIG